MPSIDNVFRGIVVFDGATQKILNYLSNNETEIQAPIVTSTGTGKYTISLFSNNPIDDARIAYAYVFFQVQGAVGSRSRCNVIASPTSESFGEGSKITVSIDVRKEANFFNYPYVMFRIEAAYPTLNKL